MNRALILALAAPACAAHAQTWTWLADVEHPIMDPSKGITTQTVTLTALMEHDEPYVIMGATIYDTLGDAGAYGGHITDWEILNQFDELTGDLTTTDGVSLYNTNAGQLCATFGPCTNDNPVDVMTFTWELNEDTPLDRPFDVTYLTLTAEAFVKAGDDADDADFIEARIINEAAINWTVLPAPSTALILTIPLALSRRRPRQ
jgi:hypothetical protein